MSAARYFYDNTLIKNEYDVLTEMSTLYLFQ